MALEIRRGRDGKPIGHWYGAYVDRTGRRRGIPLKEPLVGEMPKSLKELGDPLFEASRARAAAELERFKEEERAAGRADHLTEKLIESKTGQKWEEVKLADLQRARAEERRKLIEGKDNSTHWQEWKCSVIERFCEWAQKQGFRTVIDVNKKAAQAYIAMLLEPGAAQGEACYTPATVRNVRSVLQSVFADALPGGAKNPFSKITIRTPEGGATQSRTPLNAAQLEQLLQAARGDPFAYPLIVTAVSTGLRRGDVCRLQWESVNLNEGFISVKTAKTQAAVTVPIMSLFRRVLEGALSAREPGARFVFPDAARMIEENPDGVSYRIKKCFAAAFSGPQDAQEAQEVKPLADALGEVLEAVRGAEITESKRAKLIDLLELYASGKSYREIEAERRISRGAISGLLHEAQRLSGIQFLPDAGARMDSIKKQLKDTTRKARTVGRRDASKYDFHSLRTTFVTLALTGPEPMPREKLIALTGHSTVETAMRHYFKPEGKDFRKELEAAMPQSLSGRKHSKKALPEPKADPVAAMAAQLQALTEDQRAQLAAMLKVGVA